MRTWLKKLRKENKLTQTDLAKDLGISQHYYCNIENGKRQADLNLSLAFRLSDVLGISMEDVRKHELSGNLSRRHKPHF